MSCILDYQFCLQIKHDIKSKPRKHKKVIYNIKATVASFESSHAIRSIFY